MSEGQEIAFDLGDVLSVMFQRCLSLEGTESIFILLRHMAGEDVFSHNLPEILPWAIERLDGLLPGVQGAVALPPDNVDEDEFLAWLTPLKRKFGEQVMVPSFAGEWEKQKPLDELAKIKGIKK